MRGKDPIGVYFDPISSKQKCLMPLVRTMYWAFMMALYLVAWANTSATVALSLKLISGALHSASSNGWADESMTTTSAR